MHPLHQALIDAAGGRFPPVDGLVDVHRPEPGGTHAVVEFTGHAVMLTDRPEDDVRAREPDGFGGASHPDMLRWLAGDGAIGSLDAVLVSPGTGGGDLPARHDLEAHPRVVRSRRHRTDVRVHGDDTGFVTIGRGLVGRTEMSVELIDPRCSGRGIGRRLIVDALGLVPAGSLLWAQVAPGNAASLRALLDVGFTPIGAETLLEPRESGTEGARS